MPTKKTIDFLKQRFGGANEAMLDRVLTPYSLLITAIDVSSDGKKATFRASVPADVWTIFEEGTTGKVVPKDYVEGVAPWREVVKGRILASHPDHVDGELYFDGAARLRSALKEVRVGDYLEVDPFGVASKIESALCEAAFFQMARAQGFEVVRMPENVAMHIGTQNYHDFRLEKDGKAYRVELKSLWGTNTTKARLIHTVSKGAPVVGPDGKPTRAGKNSARADRQEWKISTCRFHDQDIFAVSLWLRTGRIDDFAFALSRSQSDFAEWGVPSSPMHPEHVIQNPVITDDIADPWSKDLHEICNRVDESRRRSQ